MSDHEFQNELISVGYEMKNQVKLFVGERSKIMFDSGCKMFDLILKDTFQFDFISFQNFYTGYLTIKAKEKSHQIMKSGINVESNKNDWKILVKRLKLMENVHGEPGNLLFTITKDMMMDKNLKTISQLRFILQQPSPYWKDFGIDDIKLKIYNPELSLEKQIEEFSKKCEKTKKVNFEKLPPIEMLATRLQNLWSICHDASKLSKNDIEDNPRFDVDDTYDINLLSYNNNPNTNINSSTNASTS